jgi:phosphoribosyl-ATP pyrophosphohydrolase/phosphoribosyl-AMP cyclohydrolase
MSFENLRYDDRGLIPAIIQDSLTGEVLMLAYMNRESLIKTLSTGHTHFWSRSRNEMWHKGETSGNYQHVERIAIDCDGDALLVHVRQDGVACHTGKMTCFHTEAHAAPGARTSLAESIGILARTIKSRKAAMPEGSYTTYLFQHGIDKILKKVGEEAGEVIIAAKNHNASEIAWETSDLLYHLLVMLEEEGISLSAISAELIKRRSKPQEK